MITKQKNRVLSAMTVLFFLKKIKKNFVLSFFWMMRKLKKYDTLYLYNTRGVKREEIPFPPRDRIQIYRKGGFDECAIL